MGDYLDNVLRYCRSVNKNYEVHSTYHVLIVPCLMWKKDFFLYSTIKSCMENTKFMQIYLWRRYGWSTQRTVGRKSQLSPFSNSGCSYSNFSSKIAEKYPCYTKPAVDFIY